MGETGYKSVGQLRVVFAALMVGLAMTGAVLVFMAASPGSAPPASASSQALLIALACVAAADVVAVLVIRSAFVGQATRLAATDGRADAMLQRYGVLTILRGALLEGAGLFGCVVFYLTGERWALAAPLLALGLMAAIFPGRAGLEAFVRDAAGRGAMFPDAGAVRDRKGSP